MFHIKVGYSFTKEVFQKWQADNVPLLGAALAYYAAFAIAPLLVVMLAIGGVFFGRAAAEGEVIDTIRFYVGTEGAETISGMLENAEKSDRKGFAAVVGMIALLLGASGLFNQLQNAMNIIWRRAPKEDASWREIIIKRLFGYLMILLVGFLLLVSILAGAILSNINKRLGPILTTNIHILQMSELLGTVILIGLFFSSVFKYLPDCKVRWSDALVGGALTAVLFAIGKYLISFYLGHSSAASIFGAAGSLAVLLLWIYYTAHIFFLGAEFTYVYAKRRHGRAC